MAFENKAVRTVIEVLHDGEKGFQSLGEQLKDLQAKRYFIEEATVRGRYATELESALGSATGETVDEGGTASGTIHRAWAELKAKMGGSDHTLLETAEQGEDAAKKAYDEVLKMKDVPPNVVSILRKQQTHILESHDRVKAMRDITAA
ncbi:MAG: PA2169 family four-helix-bundle protein [Edaphobacter sp.]|uniref:PA2169 family four-helix-bundle protein n=1 Tax=Edaphobacter sp. TaxID=1934404 RepID=UPI0023A583C3|nr:PA2169 family four-helix-bundle protein [Edaphobacter sp.]MDE1175922.1 PA2169 family four-helix-bundle protein [Edaphobacter sp.]